jgi:hypothetical protein
MNPAWLIVAFAAVALADTMGEYGVQSYGKKEYGQEGYATKQHSYGYEEKSYGSHGGHGHGHGNGYNQQASYHGRYSGM